MSNPFSGLSIKIFADGADKSRMLDMYARPYIRGFTTNPILMRQAGIVNYHAFASDILNAIPDRPISFEVCADDLHQMESQARAISSWGPNVYVKIPVMNTLGQPTYDLLYKLASAGIKLNATAITTIDQVRDVTSALAAGPSCFISILAGRIADTGRDPVRIVSAALELLHSHSNVELIWASTREMLNVFQADDIGCHIITLTAAIWAKIDLIGKDMNDLSLDAVKELHHECRMGGYML